MGRRRVKLDISPVSDGLHIFEKGRHIACGGVLEILVHYHGDDRNDDYPDLGYHILGCKGCGAIFVDDMDINEGVVQIGGKHRFPPAQEFGPDTINDTNSKE